MLTVILRLVLQDFIAPVKTLDDRLFLRDHAYYDEIAKVPCIISLVKKYIDAGEYQQGGLVVISIPRDLNLIGKRILEELNEEIEHKGSFFIGNVETLHAVEDFPASTRSRGYILLLDNANEVEKVMPPIKAHPSWNPTAPFIVLFSETKMSEFRLTVQTKSVMQELFEHSVVDVYVISNRYKTSVIQSQTWYPYEGKNCGENVISVRTINECEFFGEEQSTGNETEKNNNEKTDDEEEDESEEGTDDELFLLQYDFSNLGPKLPFYMHECPVRVAASALEPFVIKRKTKTEGFEVVMTKVISEQMNLVPIFKTQDPIIADKLITENNITGLYADIVNNKVDIMIGGMFDNKITSKILSSSIGYIEDDLTWCVATARSAPTWMNVFAIFDFMTWAIAVILVWITGMGLYFMLKYENKRADNFIWCTLVAMAVSINVSAPYHPTPRYIRIFLASFFLYSMHFSAAYQSFLVSVITQPRYQKQVKDQEMAVSYGFTFTGSENILSYLHRNDSTTKYIRDHFVPCKNIDKCLVDLKTDETKAVATSRLHAENNKVVTDEHIFCFPRSSNIHSYAVKMLVRKDYHLLPKFDDLIARAVESGLFGKWFGEEKARRLNIKPLQKAASQSTAQPLTLKHLAGAYALLFFGLVCSSLSFCLEWIVFYLGSTKKYKFFRRIEELFMSNYRKKIQ
uniref:CSON005703 protein n=1 Tax=Culicoides sonorensis TaxID=179676 RepID=A0A336KKK9_CULSO